jgi:lysyl-tRNA synthetase class 1
VVVAQIGGFDVDRVVEILEKGGYPDLGREALQGRLAYARRWLERFAPEDMRFEVPDDVPAAAAGLGERERGFLRDLADRLEPGQDGRAVHALIYDRAQAHGLEKGPAFRAVYIATLGRPRGPRAGDFLVFLGPDFARERLRGAADSG